VPGRLIFIESNTTGTGALALSTADRLGLRPVLVTAAPGRYRGLAGTGAEVVLADTNDATALASCLDGFAGDLAGITTTSEYYLLAVAESARRLGLPGNPPATVRACRDKAATRALLTAAGLYQPRFAVAADERRTAEALDRVGLPCVVKPADESGSQDVLLCTGAEQATAHARRIRSAGFNARGQAAAGVALVEEVLPGPEYSVETFTRAGVTTCLGITAKSVGGEPHFVETGHRYPAELAGEQAGRLAATVTAALVAAGVREGPAHTEVKLLPDGTPAIVEINLRLAGGMIPELIRLVTGVDLIERQVRAAAGLPVAGGPATGSRVGGIRFVTTDRSGTVATVAGVDRARAVRGVREVSVRAVPGTAVVPTRDAYTRLGHVIAVGGDRPGVERALDRALDLISIAVA
jgi:cysteine synthase A